MSELPSTQKNETDQDRSVSKDLQAYITGGRPDFHAYYHLEDKDHRDRHEKFSPNLQAISESVVVTPIHDWEPVKLVTLMQACGSTQIVRTECLRSETEQPYAVIYEAGEPTIAD